MSDTELNHNLEDKQQCSSINFNSFDNEIIDQENVIMKLVPIKYSKHILKDKKNSRKGFIKKVLAIQPLLKELSIVNKFLLFGYQDIETYYKDYSSAYDNNLVELSNALVGVDSIENNMLKNEIQINMYSKGSSGIVDFQFLIDHFKRFTTQDYQKLCNELIRYQELALLQNQHYQQLKIKVNSRILSEDDFIKAQEQFTVYVDKYIQSLAESQCFYSYYIYWLDFTLMDVAPVKRCISQALLSLMGVEPNDYKNFVLHQAQLFSNSSGQKRITDAIDFIHFILDDTPYQYKDLYLKTIDKISIPARVEQFVIYWDERPHWSKKLDFILIVDKFDLSTEKIQYVIEQRQKLDKIHIDLDIYETIQFDYVVQTEIFLEKFYPEAYKNIKQKKSITSNLFSERNDNQIVIE